MGIDLDSQTKNILRRIDYYYRTSTFPGHSLVLSGALWFRMVQVVIDVRGERVDLIPITSLGYGPASGRNHNPRVRGSNPCAAIIIYRNIISYTH